MQLSNRAKNILGFMVFETWVMGFYMVHAARLPNDISLLSAAMGKLSISVTIVSIIGGIIVTAIINGTKDKEAADERDLEIEGKAMGYAYRALFIGISIFIAHLFLNQTMISGYFPATGLLGQFRFAPTPLNLMSYMLAILWLGETTKYLSQLRFYKRGL